MEIKVCIYFVFEVVLKTSLNVIPKIKITNAQKMGKNIIIHSSVTG